MDVVNALLLSLCICVLWIYSYLLSRSHTLLKLKNSENWLKNYFLKHLLYVKDKY